MEGTGKQEVVMVILQQDSREYSVTEADVSLGKDENTQPALRQHCSRVLQTPAALFKKQKR